MVLTCGHRSSEGNAVVCKDYTDKGRRALAYDIFAIIAIENINKTNCILQRQRRREMVTKCLRI